MILVEAFWDALEFISTECVFKTEIIQAIKPDVYFLFFDFNSGKMGFGRWESSRG